MLGGLELAAEPIRVSTDVSAPALSFRSRGHSVPHTWARPAGTRSAADSQLHWLATIREAGLQTPLMHWWCLASLCWLPHSIARYAQYQLASLAVVRAGHVGCAVMGVPRDPDSWPYPKTLLLASWALCLTFQRPYRCCWAQCSKWWWCRLSRPGLLKWAVCSCSFKDGGSELSLDTELKPRCHRLPPLSHAVFLIWHSSSL